MLESDGFYRYCDILDYFSRRFPTVRCPVPLEKGVLAFYSLMRDLKQFFWADCGLGLEFCGKINRFWDKIWSLMIDGIFEDFFMFFSHKLIDFGLSKYLAANLSS